MADLTKEELEILTEQAKPGNGWGALISRAELRELLRVYQAVAAAPVGVVKEVGGSLVMIGELSEPYRATAHPVRLVPTHSAGGE